MAQEFIDFYGEEKTISDLALNRLTESEDVVPMVVFLASGLAGQTCDFSILELF